MKHPSPRALRVLVVSLILAACGDDLIAPTATPATARSVNEGQLEAPGRYLVVFRSTAIPRELDAEVERLGGTIEHAIAAAGAVVVSNLSPGSATALGRFAGVQSVDPDPIIPMRTTRVAPAGLEVTILDADVASPAAPQAAGLFGFQWNMRAISAPQAWSAGFTGSDAVKVAILDTGIDEGNPAVGARRNIDLEGLVDRERSRSFMPIEDAIVESLFPGAPLYTDLDGHGTNVASQVSSRAFNLAGVTSRTRLLALKVCTILPPPATPANPDPDPGFCSTASIFAAFEYAVSEGADVINLSLGGGFLKRSCLGCASVFNRLMQYANQRGVTVVVAAGNDAIDLDHATNYYATYCDATHVICVAATGAVASGPAQQGPFITPDAPAVYSNFGRSAIDVAAPGGNYTIGVVDDEPAIVEAAFVWSLCPRRTASAYVPAMKTVLPLGACGLYGFIGTSQASPHVAGLAAMLIAKHGRNPALIRDILTQTADQLGRSGNSARYGMGRINVVRAMTEF